MAGRGYTSYPFQGFGEGLNLTDKPDAVSPAECIDCMDVSFTDRGAIEQRAGYEALATLTNRVDSLSPFYRSSGVRQLIAGCGSRLEALSVSGEVLASETGLSDGPYGFARFGAPTAEVIYAGNGTDAIRKWDGSAWSTPTASVDGISGKAMPTARFLAVLPQDHRLLATGFRTNSGGPGGAISSPAHAYFSEPGNPESWMTEGTEAHPENSEQFAPGDGEEIQGVISWGEFTFVFKETKYFVIWGVSADGRGNPVFNYRTVDTGVGLVAPETLCADASGVYFMGRGGVYRTTGQAPQLISGKIEPIWAGGASPFFTGGTLAHTSITDCAATIHEGRLYLSYPTVEANDRTLVYDPGSGWWSLYSLACGALTSFRVGASQELVFGYAAGKNKIARHRLAVTNDDGAPISSYWRSGWFDLGSPDVKTIRSEKVWGTGTVSMAVGYDFRRSVGQVEQLTLEDQTAPEWGDTQWDESEWAEPRGLTAAERRVAVRGTTFSVYFSNNLLDQSWSIHRIDHHVRETRKPSTVNG